LAFFEAALARAAKVSLANARTLIHDPGGLGFHSLYRKAGFPEPLFPPFRAAIEVVTQTDYEGGENERARFVERLLERLLTFFDHDNAFTESDRAFLLARLDEEAA
jgi:uncharacterized protein (DUF2336 family)